MALLGNIQKKQGTAVYVPGIAGVPAQPAKLAVAGYTRLVKFVSDEVRSVGTWYPRNPFTDKGEALVIRGTGTTILSFRIVSSRFNGTVLSYSDEQTTLTHIGSVWVPDFLCWDGVTRSLFVPQYQFSAAYSTQPASPAVLGVPATNAYTYRLANSGWDALTDSSKVVDGDFAVSYTYCEGTGIFMGVGSPDTSSIEHSFYGSGKFAYVSENGLPTGYSHAVQTGSVLGLSRVAGVVRYTIDGAPVHTSLVTSTGQKVARVNLYAGGDQITATSISQAQACSVRGTSAMTNTFSRALKATGINLSVGTVFARQNLKIDVVALGSTTNTFLARADMGLAGKARGLAALTGTNFSAVMSGSIRPIQGFASSGIARASAYCVMQPASVFAVSGMPIPRIATMYGDIAALIGYANMLSGSVGTMSGSAETCTGFAACRPSLAAVRKYALASGPTAPATGYAHGQADSPVRSISDNLALTSLFTALRTNTTMSFGGVL